MLWWRRRFKVPVLSTRPIMPRIAFECNGSKRCCDKTPPFLMSTMSTVLPNKSVPMQPNSIAGLGANSAAASNIFACHHVGCSQEETAGAFAVVAAAVSNVVVVVIKKKTRILSVISLSLNQQNRPTLVQWMAAARAVKAELGRAKVVLGP